MLWKNKYKVNILPFFGSESIKINRENSTITTISTNGKLLNCWANNIKNQYNKIKKNKKSNDNLKSIYTANNNKIISKYKKK